MPFSLPPSLSKLRCLSLTLTQTPLPITQPLAMRNLCLELTRWADTARDVACISLQTSLVTLKLFVNKIASPRTPPLLDLAPFTALRHLEEVHVVSYQLNRPLLSLPYIPSLRKLELHNLAICPTDLYQYSSLISLRFSLLSMSTDVDDTIEALLRQNTSLRSLGLSWDANDASFPCHCMRSAPPSIEKLALAPLVPFCELSHLTALVHLDLRSCPNAFSTAYLTALTALRTLVIDERPPFRLDHWSDLQNLRKIMLVPTFGELEEVQEITQQVRAALPQVELVVDPPEKELEL